MTEIAALWARAQFEVSGYISVLIPDYHDAQDIIQCTAVTVVQKYDQYDRNSPFRNWAIGVARLEVLKYREHKAHEKMIFSQALIDQVSQIFCD